VLRFTLTPYDVLFFGSGRPFHMGGVVASVFPPHPNTFASAICAKINQIRNIKITNILKAVYGPFIKKGNKIYFPKPQNVYKERKKKDVDKVFIVRPLDISLNLLNLKILTNLLRYKHFLSLKDQMKLNLLMLLFLVTGLKNG
jgi:CRISPR-associated protein (Cas_Cmr3).